MRYTFNRFMSYVTVFIIGLLMLVNVGHSRTYKSLHHRPLPSPDGKYIVMIDEDRYPNGSEYSLALWKATHEGKRVAGKYSLTPRYEQIVASPDGKIIAFVEFNATTHYGVHYYLSDVHIIKPGQVYRMNKIDRFQFSKDQKYHCSRTTYGHRFETIKENINAKLLGSDWTIAHAEIAGPQVFKENGEHLWTEKEKEAFTEWAPAEKPKVIPQFLTQPMPKIGLQTQMQWSPDSRYLYLFDETGLWRCKVGNYYRPQWTKLVNSPGIARFQLSPIGTTVVYEVIPTIPLEQENRATDADKMERIIWTLNLEKIDAGTEKITESESKASGAPRWLLDATQLLSPHKIAIGWGVTFTPNGKILHYANLKGTYRLILDTMEIKRYYPTTWQP